MPKITMKIVKLEDVLRLEIEKNSTCLEVIPHCFWAQSSCYLENNHGANFLRWMWNNTSQARRNFNINEISSRNEPTPLPALNWDKSLRRMLSDAEEDLDDDVRCAGENISITELFSGNIIPCVALMCPSCAAIAAPTSDIQFNNEKKISNLSLFPIRSRKCKHAHCILCWAGNNYHCPTCFSKLDRPTWETKEELVFKFMKLF